ncbi:dephospho-CoA kinase [Pelagibacterium montanilacus]|uniref:dephospho-CoA kinase n=1 Tax=Pelagibacterium montanilacus TaxID=2185280 RepID=UPI000F8E88DD|nr:dephospho-CoA kinase [Pelagibacterium montanilacus]
MLRIGLTGSIATGKTTVLKAFEEEGIPTYSADAAVHELYAGEAAPTLETMFPGVVREGRVDRSALSAMLSQAPERVAELEAVVHPMVRDKAQAFFDAAEAEGAPMAVVEIPLLFETGSRYPLDVVVVTHCAPETLRARALARPNMTGAKLDMILARQMSQDEKRGLADHLIDTSGTMDDTLGRTRALIEALKAQSTAS